MGNLPGQIILINFAFLEGLTRVIVVLKPPLDSYHADFDLKIDMLKKTDVPEQTILFIGDSLTERSIYAEYLQMMLNAKGHSLQVLNLATPGATPEISLAILKNYVQKVGRPKLVVMGVTFRAFHRYWQTEAVKGENQNDSMHQSYFGRCLSDKPKSISEKALCLMQKHLLLIRYPNILSELARQLPLYIVETKNKVWSLRDDRAILPFKQGWVPRRDEYRTRQTFYEYQAERESDFQHYDDYFIDADKANWYSEAFMDSIVKYSQQNNIRFVLLIPPTTKSFNTVFYDQALKLPKSRFLNLLKIYAQKNGLLFWDLSETLVPQEALYFNDIVHLNVIGSLMYSEMLVNPLLNLK